ncbi:MAG TPA: leucine-rich repeat protein, partial [Luteolibacter sp.]|nr:leucine-rich repeat protein [Luteolibacter sp.]
LANKEFSYCTELTSVSIPSTTNSIDPKAFQFCTKLATIAIDPANTSFTTVGGIVYSFDVSTLVRVPPAYAGTVNIPATVTTIANGAFDDCSAITDFAVDAGNISFESVDGLLFSEDLSALIRCPAGHAGAYAVTATVTTINGGAFNLCQGLTSITVDGANPNYSSQSGALFNKDLSTLIRCPGGYVGSFQVPAASTAINGDAFDDCTAMTSISVEGGNATYSSSDGVLYNLDQTELIKCPAGFRGSHAPPPNTTSIGSNAFLGCASLTAITFPPSLTTIDDSAFRSCSGLSSIIIPESVSLISWWAFFNCDNLSTITFLGDAPTLNGYGSLFSTTSGDPTIDHFDDATGFTSLNWMGYPLTGMGSETGLKKWLIKGGLSYNQNPQADLNGDGVSLLTAYALNLDPGVNNAANMPQGVVNGANFEMEFYSAAEGINYTVECSEDLINWSPTGVSLSALSPEGLRTASLAIGSGKRFMRLVLDESP